MPLESERDVPANQEKDLTPQQWQEFIRRSIEAGREAVYWANLISRLNKDAKK